MSKKYTATSIGRNTYAINEKTAINQGLCYLLCGEERALLIDTGMGYDSLKPTVDSLTKLPVIVANTHAHIDHIGGNHFFNEQWFHEKDKRIFELHCNPSYTAALLTGSAPAIVTGIMKLLLKKRLAVDPAGDYHYFGDDKVFELGERRVEVLPTPGHTPGSVCFLDSENRMLFSGDTICEWGILLHFKGESCTPAEYLSSVERIISHENEFDAIWPGHHGFPVDKKYLEKYRQCAMSILDGSAVYKTVNGCKSACFEDVLISVPEEC